MTYVMSDLHGMYDRFIAMLEKIDFSDSDELFIIGDIIDRGERPVDILEYVMDKPNITVLLGNHEVMARDFLRRLTAEITDGNTASFDNDFMVELAIYKHNGGIPTINRLLALPPDKQQSVLDFIDSLYAYEAIDVGDSTFVLVHAGLGNFRKDKKISEYSLYELLELRPDYERQYFAAAFFLGIYSELMARKTKSPSTLYLVVGMIPLIPGAALYYMMRNAIQTNFKMFAERGLEAVITGGAIASGIITAMVCWNVIKLNLLKK